MRSQQSSARSHSCRAGEAVLQVGEHADRDVGRARGREPLGPEGGVLAERPGQARTQLRLVDHASMVGVDHERRIRLRSHQEVGGEGDARERKADPRAHLDVHDRERDRDALAAREHRIEKAVPRVVVLVSSPQKPAGPPRNAVSCATRAASGPSRGTTCAASLPRRSSAARAAGASRPGASSPATPSATSASPTGSPPRRRAASSRKRSEGGLDSTRWGYRLRRRGAMGSRGVRRYNRPPCLRCCAARSRASPSPIWRATSGRPATCTTPPTIRARIEDLRPFDVIRYAQKANSNLAVLDLCRRQGVLVDAVSAGEIHRALLAGYAAQGDPPPIVYTADVFDRESLELVVEHGIAVDCGSADMIDQYAERGGAGELALRVNPGFGHGHSRKTNTGGEHSKHGIWCEEVGDCLRRASRRGLSRRHPAHAHRLGRGPRAPGARGGRDGALRARSRLADPLHQCGRRAPGAVSRARSEDRRAAPLRDLGRRRESASRTASATRCGSRSSRAATWWRRPASW